MAGLLGVLTPGLAGAQPVINELHYDSPNPLVRSEFVELVNPGPGPSDLSGWHLSGGVSFTFPAGTTLPAGAYLVVAEDPTALRRQFPAVTATVLGPWIGRLGAEGDRVELLDGAGSVQDRVEYRRGFPWPIVGDPPGYSIELIHPSLDNSLGGSWRASTTEASGATSRSTVVQNGSDWRFFRGRSEASSPTTAWREPAFNDASWETGALPIGYDPAVPLATRLDDMRGNYVAVFLRKTFAVSTPETASSLEVQALYDDSFKLWINGVLVVEANIAPGEVPFDGTGGTARESNAYESFAVPLPAGLLKPTGNVVAVQAHNSSLSSSSDFFFDANLVVVRGATGQGPTPGQRNVVWSTNAPPAIRQVDHTPVAPRSGQPVVVTAKVTDPEGVASVTLEYQVVRPGAYIELGDSAFETTWTSLEMRDDGAGGDATAGDDVFSATVPAAIQAHRTLVRYRVTAADRGGRSVRVPYADDPQPNFAYFVYDGVPAWTGALRPGAAGNAGQAFRVGADEMNRLPVIHLIARQTAVEEATWLSQYGGDAYPWVGTLVLGDRVYDHIHYRARGGVWRYAMCKNMWKFDFNRGHELEVRDDWGRKLSVSWKKLNLGASIQQGDYNHRGEQGMFESTGFRVFQLAGVPAMHSTFAQFRVVDAAAEAPADNQYEGDFWGVYLMLEQPDGRFLEQHGMPDGNFYKMEGGSGELNNLGPAGPADKSDLNAFLGSYSGATEAWWGANFNVANFLSYQTVVQAIHHYDICYDKNYFYYRNPDTRLWQVVPWDLDLTWAENMYDSGCGGVDRIKERLLPNATRYPAIWRQWQNRIREFRDLFWNDDEAARLIDEQAGRLRGPATGPTLLDADRAQWDYNPKMVDGRYSTSPGSKAGWGRYYAWPNYPLSEVSRDFDGCLQLMKRYIGFRSTNSNARARALDLIAADANVPARPRITYSGSTNYPVNALRFGRSEYAGTAAFAAARWRVGEITVPTAPSWAASEPWKYEFEPVWESDGSDATAAEVRVPAGVLRVGGHYRARVRFEDAEGRTSRWSEPVEFVAGAPDNSAFLADALKVTELMYHAPGGSTNDFIELYNDSDSALSLAGAKFTQGIDFTFPAGATLQPKTYALVVKAPAANNYAGFRTYYGTGAGVPIFGPYSGNLSDSGETVVLRDAAGGTDLIAFTYSDGRGWPLAADGAGHSLVPTKPSVAGASGALDFGGNWRASAFIRGSPGAADPTPEGSIVLNEVVAHTDYLSEFDSNDWVELYNRGTTPVTLGAGWYLSDDGDQLRRWAIPAGTVVPAKGWVTFDEVTGFNVPRGTGFSLNKEGEQVYLSHFPAGSPGRVVDCVSFKAQENEWALARVPDGGAYWDQVIPRTQSAANAALLPRVVISEILYHEGGLPTNQVAAPYLEFVELHNASPQPVALFNTNAVWRLNGGVTFDLPLFTTLAAGERALVVAFDPVISPAILAGFRSTLGVPASVRVLGPYTGRLDNHTDRVALERAQSPDLPGDPISWVVVDEVIYLDAEPWPGGADGVGKSYQRRSATIPGSDPANWYAAVPTPGSGSSVADLDTDADGMTDAWESAHGLDPRDPLDASRDDDGDGLTNRAEFLAGTDPRDAASALVLRQLRLTGDLAAEFSFNAVAGRAYVVEERDPSGTDGWVILENVSAGTSDRVVTVRVSVAASERARFQRVRLR